MAKAALQQIPDVGNNVITFAACKYIVSKQITCTWQRRWDRSPTARTTYEYVPSVGKRTMFHARRCTPLSYSRLLLNDSSLRIHQHHAGLVDTKKCECGQGVDDAFHYFFQSDLVISMSHWCKLLIRHGLKPTVKYHPVVLLYCCLHRPISKYSQRISARTFWTLFLLSLISLDVAFNIIQIHENGQKT